MLLLSAVLAFVVGKTVGVEYWFWVGFEVGWVVEKGVVVGLGLTADFMVKVLVESSSSV